jgi:putative two-component system response regulator
VRWNGKGDPHGLSGDAIPQPGRIVAIIDVFDALTMDRCCGPVFTDAQARVTR